MSVRSLGGFLTGRRGSLHRRFTLLLTALFLLILLFGLSAARTIHEFDTVLRGGVAAGLDALAPALDLRHAIAAAPRMAAETGDAGQVAAEIDAGFAALLNRVPPAGADRRRDLLQAQDGWQTARTLLQSGKAGAPDYGQAIAPVVAALDGIVEQADRSLRDSADAAGGRLRQAALALALGVLFCFILLGLLARLFRRGVLLPLRALRRATTLLGESRQIEPLALVHSNDEMGSLAHALSDAAERMQGALARARQTGEQDVATGLLHKAEFERRLRVEVSRSRRYGHDVTILVCRVAGDGDGGVLPEPRLRALADVLASALRPSDVLARTGQSELAVLLPETRRDGAQATMERLHRLAVLSAGAERLEIGLSCYPHDSEHARDLLDLARVTLDQVGPGAGRTGLPAERSGGPELPRLNQVASD